MKELTDLIAEYKKRHPKYGDVSVTIYSDGSGYAAGKYELFWFNNLDELKKELDE